MTSPLSHTNAVFLARGEGSSAIRHAKPGDNDKREVAIAAAVLFEENIDGLATGKPDRSTNRYRC